MRKTTGVIVHKCYSADLGDPMPPKRSPRRGYSGRICRCKELISDTTAEQWVDEGQALWVGKGQIAFTGRVKKTPRGATIEKAHIERAYIDKDEEEVARIEEYGIITLLSRIRIGRYYVTLKEEPVGGRDTDWGRPLFSRLADERTSGGIGIDSKTEIS